MEETAYYFSWSSSDSSYSLPHSYSCLMQCVSACSRQMGCRPRLLLLSRLGFGGGVEGGEGVAGPGVSLVLKGFGGGVEGGEGLAGLGVSLVLNSGILATGSSSTGARTASLWTPTVNIVGGRGT